MNAFDGEHPFLHHLVEQRDDAVDVLGGVDDLDHDRQVLGQPQDARRVQAGIGAETLDAAQDGRAGEALLANALDDCLVQGLAVPRVRLADEEPQELALTLELHSALPVMTPR